MDTGSDIILFRADTSKTAGLGHLARCISLAKKIASETQRPLFAIKEEELVAENMLISEGMDFFKIKRSSCGRKEAEDIARMVSGERIKGIVLDSYDLTNEYLEEIRGINSSITLIDDRNYLSNPDVDTIINGNAFSVDLDYAVNKDTRLFVGTEYYMVSEDFISDDGISQNSDRNIQTGLCVSSADEKTLLGIIEKTISVTTGDIVIILTAHQKNMLDGVNKLIGEAGRRIKVCHDLSSKDVADIMRQSVLFVSGGGTMMYQAMLSGCLVMALPLNEYQSRNVDSLVRMKAVKKINEEDIASEGYGKVVTEMLNKNAVMDSLLEHSKNIIDGRGVERVSSIILNSCRG